MIAGGVESMTRAPFVHAQGRDAVRRGMKLYDTTHRLALRQSAR